MRGVLSFRALQALETGSRWWQMGAQRWEAGTHWRGGQSQVKSAEDKPHCSRLAQGCSRCLDPDCEFHLRQEYS